MCSCTQIYVTSFLTIYLYVTYLEYNNTLWILLTIRPTFIKLTTYLIYFLFQDFSDCYRLAGPSAGSSNWNQFPSDLNIFKISKKPNIEDVEEEPMIVCLENLPPIEQKVRIQNKQNFSVAPNRVPLGTINTNSTQLNILKPKTSSNVMKPKPVFDVEASPKAPPTKKLRLSQSWSQ